MTYYAQINTERIVVGVTQTAAPVDEPHMVLLESYDVSTLGKRHDAQSGQFVELATQVPGQGAPETRRVSVLGFRRRFTPAEKAAIEWAAVDRPDQPLAQRMQAAALRATLADQAAAEFIDLDDADTVQGVQGLEALGHIAPGRAMEILTAPIQPEELP